MADVLTAAVDLSRLTDSAISVVVVAAADGD